MGQMSDSSLISYLFKYIRANIREQSIKLRLISYRGEDYICKFDGVNYFPVICLRASIDSYFKGKSVADIRSELLWKIYETLYHPEKMNVRISLKEIVANPTIYLSDKVCPYSIYMKMYGTSFSLVGNKGEVFPLSEMILEDAGLKFRDVLDMIKDKALESSLDAEKARSLLSLNPEISGKVRYVLESLQCIKLEDDMVFPSSVLGFKESIVKVSENFPSRTFYVVFLSNKDVLVSDSKHLTYKRPKENPISLSAVLCKNIKLRNHDDIKLFRFSAKSSRLFACSDAFIV